MVTTSHIIQLVATTGIADRQRVAADRRMADDLRRPRIKRVRTGLLGRAQEHRPTSDLATSMTHEPRVTSGY
jgi:hypothetical protein